MELIIGTHSFLLQATIDKNLNLSTIVPIKSYKHHYGICPLSNTDYSFIAMTRENNCFEFYKKNSISEKINHQGYELVSIIKPTGNFSDIHQIVCQDNGIYIANTGYNSICFISNQGKRIEYFIDHKKTDVNHINSIFTLSNKRALILLHNKGESNSKVVLIQRKKDKIIPLHSCFIWDKKCHNIYLNNKYLVYNSSVSGELVIVDLMTQKIIKRIDFSGHTKGLSVTEKYFVIGVSEHAKGKKRFYSKGNLAIIDRNTLNVVRILDINTDNLPQAVGNINEVRCLSEKDYSLGYLKPLLFDFKSLKLADVNIFDKLLLMFKSFKMIS